MNRSHPNRGGAQMKGPAIPRAMQPQVVAAPVVSNAFHHAPNAALLIDFDNVTLGIQKDLSKELRSLLASDIIKGKVAVQRAYADWRRYPQYIVSLAESSIDMIMAPAYGSSKKNATDIRLAIDAMELVFTRPEIGTFILLSGDSDFSSLVMKLKEYGKYVIGVGIRESASDLLVQNCDEYYSYNALAGLTRTNDDEIARRDPWELVSEAIQRMKRNGDVMRSDRLKQVMQELDPSFDEKNLGYSKFSRFCMEAAQKGLLAVQKLDNGQLEVAPSGDALGGSSAAAPREPRAEGDPERGGRSGRGRRGRGRGRERERVAGDTVSATPAEGDVPVTAPVTDGAAIDAPPPPPRAHAPVHTPRPPRRVEEPLAVGLAGERLTRDEAFDLVRRSVAALVRGDDVVRAVDVRRKSHELLGRDSESLSERNFPRILRDAHDQEIIDLRRRGDDYEVGLAVATPVADQLTAAAAAHAVPKSTAPAGPRGMGHRTAPSSRGRGPIARAASPPANLFSVGVVGHASPVAIEPEVIVATAAEAEGVPAKAKRPSRAKKPAAKAAKAGSDADAPKPRRPRAKKVVAE